MQYLHKNDKRERKKLNIYIKRQRLKHKSSNLHKKVKGIRKTINIHDIDKSDKKKNEKQ